MTRRVLLVDDDPRILDSLKRNLRNQFTIEIALGPADGLKAVSERGPFAVVISDLRMPNMDGIQFLARVRKIAPDTVRMVLTGHADLEDAIQAVNEGKVFQFLTKPCHPLSIAKALAKGIEQYRLITAERELLEQTFRGSLKVLIDLVAITNPRAFGRSTRIRRYVREITDHMGISRGWRFEIAAMLSQIGLVILPEEALEKIYQGKELTEKNRQIFDMHPSIASELLANIPRMEAIAEIIEYQEKHFDGSGIPSDSRKGEEIPLGARILKVVLDFDTLEVNGMSKEEAVAEMEKRSGCYDPAILEALKTAVGLETDYEFMALTVDQLMENTILAEDVLSEKGQLLLSKGQEVSRPLIERLKNFVETSRVQQPIHVMVPLKRQREITEAYEANAELGKPIAKTNGKSLLWENKIQNVR